MTFHRFRPHDPPPGARHMADRALEDARHSSLLARLKRRAAYSTGAHSCMSVVTTIVSSSSSTASSNQGEVPRASHAAPSVAMRSGRALRLDVLKQKKSQSTHLQNFVKIQGVKHPGTGRQSRPVFNLQRTEARELAIALDAAELRAPRRVLARSAPLHTHTWISFALLVIAHVTEHTRLAPPASSSVRADSRTTRLITSWGRLSRTRCTRR